jgi:hypothetical protein
VALAKRTGSKKSILLRWLNQAADRISPSMLLSIAVFEAVSVAGLMRGDLTRESVLSDLFPDRVPWRLFRLDHERIGRQLRGAKSAGATADEAAKNASASTASVARDTERYPRRRVIHQARPQQRRSEDKSQALQGVEQVVLKSLRLGLGPTLRRAVAGTGFKWLPSPLQSMLLIELRRAIGEPRIRTPLKALSSGAALQSDAPRLRRASLPPLRRTHISCAKQSTKAKANWVGDPDSCTPRSTSTKTSG